MVLCKLASIGARQPAARKRAWFRFAGPLLLIVEETVANTTSEKELKEKLRLALKNCLRGNFSNSIISFHVHRRNSAHGLFMISHTGVGLENDCGTNAILASTLLQKEKMAQMEEVVKNLTASHTEKPQAVPLQPDYVHVSLLKALNPVWNTHLIAPTRIIDLAGRKLGVMGLVEKEWLVTLATIDPSEVDYEDFCPCARRPSCILDHWNSF
eukprot:6064500-Amphidinium_carterae.3